MPLSRTHLDAVLADLKRSREILLNNLAEIDGTIDSLEQLYIHAPLNTLKPLGRKVEHEVAEAEEKGFPKKKLDRPKKVKVTATERIVNGKIENLPPANEKESLTPHRFSQYNKQ